MPLCLGSQSVVAEWLTGCTCGSFAHSWRSPILSVILWLTSLTSCIVTILTTSPLACIRPLLSLLLQAGQSSRFPEDWSVLVSVTVLRLGFWMSRSWVYSWFLVSVLYNCYYSTIYLSSLQLVLSIWWSPWKLSPYCSVFCTRDSL